MFGHDEPKNDDHQADTTHDESQTTEVVTPSTDTTSPAYIATPTSDKSATTDAPVEAPAPTPTVAGSADLLTIKQDALKQLSPLVGHLDQTAEEKFRTTMMMIQASDDQSLIKDAYAAAQEITDEKTRAQALLDIINEINYFTQNN